MKSKIFTGLLIGVFFLAGLGYADVYSDRERKATFTKPYKAKKYDRIKRRIKSATAEELAAAMDVPAESLISASIGTSDPKGVGIFEGSLGHHLPTKGKTFVILSSGLAESAETSNSNGGISGHLDCDNESQCLKNSQGNDMVQLTLELELPDKATCLGFDFAYYSDEYSEWVGTSFNDTFTAELGESNFTITGTEVNAPNNFAFDTEGNIISVNAVFGMEGNTATTYDGGTSLLKAVTPIEPGTSVVKIVFTIQDLGDSIYDSAVFLDNFYWSTDPNCSAGASEDTDGDGLLDDWEVNGLDVDGDGKVDLDLKAMGADPEHKDIFVEVDYMTDTVCTGGYGFGECVSHSHQLKKAALQKVIDAFENAPVSNPDGKTGIRLHVDAGSDAIMDPVTGKTWGSLSKADELLHQDYLDENNKDAFNWTKFEDIKSAHFSNERKNVFRYCVSGHYLSEKLEDVSGGSRGAPASGFVMTLGAWANGIGTVNQQAGTFMHGLGNNLGLESKKELQFNPNYLSVMNPLFQTRGLRIKGIEGNFDYSRFAMPSLNEKQLNEKLGLGNVSGTEDYGTLYFTPSGDAKFVDNVTEPIDWNGDGVESTNVSADINNDGEKTVLPQTVNEWNNLVFKGGEVGSLGIIYEPPLETESDDLSKEEDDEIPTMYAVTVNGSTAVILQPGASGKYTLTIKNSGESEDTYELNAVSTLKWIDVSALPKSVTLDANESETFEIPVNVPAGTAFGSKDVLTVTFTSQANPNLSDSLKAIFTVLQTGDANADGQLDIADIQALKNYILKLGKAPGFPDINGDGKVNVLDIVALINIIIPE